MTVIIMQSLKNQLNKILFLFPNVHSIMLEFYLIKKKKKRK